MLNRQIAKRTPRTCELSLESLHARIAPSGVHPASYFISSMSSIGTAGGVIGVYHSPSTLPKGTPFYMVETSNEAGTTNYIINGGGHSNNGNSGSNLHGHPF